jgi:hypothetical protein
MSHPVAITDVDLSAMMSTTPQKESDLVHKDFDKIGYLPKISGDFF